MVEMQETANILHQATPRSLVILDEIGRGTSTFDGMSIAWAVAEFLHDFQDKGIKTLFATHYHELTELARSRPRVKNFNVAIREWQQEILFFHKLDPEARSGATDTGGPAGRAIPKRLPSGRGRFFPEAEGGQAVPFGAGSENDTISFRQRCGTRRSALAFQDTVRRLKEKIAVLIPNA